MSWKLIVLLFLAVSPAAAQSATDIGPASAERDRGWVAFGLGPGYPYGAVAVATANFGRERFIQVGIHSNTELNFLGRSASTNALNVGAGVSRVSRWDRTALALGPAIVWGLRDAANPDDRFVTAGVVLSAQAMFTPVPEVGLGLGAFVNLNPVQSGYGVGITFVFEANK
jgi:hypothetical protein